MKPQTRSLIACVAIQLVPGQLPIGACLVDSLPVPYCIFELVHVACLCMPCQ